MENTTKVVLAWELHQQKVAKTQIAKHLDKHRETVRLWIQGIEKKGLNDFLSQYIVAKQVEHKARQTDAILKRRIWEIRERESDCCGQKIQYFLQKEYDTHISVPKIYEVLKERYKIKSKWKKNKVRGPVPKANTAREVIQMDTVDFGDIFAFTGVDIYTKEVDVLIAPQLTAEHGYKFLQQAMNRRFNGHVDLLQTDGGPEFKERFKENVLNYCNRHRVARPYKKNEQSYIESFNRTLRKECLGWKKYTQSEIVSCVNRVEIFLKRYHYHRPHMGLGMRPPLITNS